MLNPRMPPITLSFTTLNIMTSSGELSTSKNDSCAPRRERKRREERGGNTCNATVTSPSRYELMAARLISTVLLLVEVVFLVL